MLLLSPMFTYCAKNCNSAGARCVVGFLEASTVVWTAGATTDDSELFCYCLWVHAPTFAPMRLKFGGYSSTPNSTRGTKYEIDFCVIKIPAFLYRQLYTVELSLSSAASEVGDQPYFPRRRNRIVSFAHLSNFRDTTFHFASTGC